MFQNFIKIAWRHLTKNPIITFIQVFGLTLGLTVFLLILLWVNNQVSFDRFNKKADQIYRLEYYSDEYDGQVDMNLAMGPNIKNNVAAVEKFVRIRSAWGGKLKVGEENTPSYKEASYRNFIWADSTFFSVFSFDFVYGDPERALLSPRDIVISESMSKKLFGDENPIGKQLTSGNLNITGVFKDVNNFHIPFDIVVSFTSLIDFYKAAEVGFKWDSWNSMDMHATYFLLNKNTDSKVVSQQMTSYYKEIKKSTRPDDPSEFELRLRPLTEIYFFGKTPKEFSYVLHGNFGLIMGLSIIALLILLLAIANFVNLNFTRTFKRAKEVGVRKVVGSNSRNVFYLFIGEVIILSIITLLFTTLLLHLFLPYYNILISANLSIGELLNKYNLFSIAISFVFIFVFAGILPSLFISSITAIKGLRSFELRNSTKGIAIRKSFLIFQYGITIVVIAATLIVQKQVSYMKDSDPGFNMTNVISGNYFYDQNKEDSKKILMKSKLLQHPNIDKVVFCHSAPPNIEPSLGSLSINGIKVQTYDVYTHPGYFDLFEIPIVAGRAFRDDIKADKAGDKQMRILINETAAKKFNLASPVGARGIVYPWNSEVEIIGVVKDFHIQSLKTSIPPIAFIYLPMAYRTLMKINGGDLNDIKQYYKGVSMEVFGRSSDGFRVVEDNYKKQYRSEEQLTKLFLWFSLLAILIASMGLYGISINAIQRRIKEIGIRKVHGASSWIIMKLLQSYFAKIVIWAGLIALPVSWFLLSRWLLNYPYKTELSWWIFLSALAFALFIAITTISWRTWKAATSNPVEAIKYE